MTRILCFLLLLSVGAPREIFAQDLDFQFTILSTPDTIFAHDAFTLDYSVTKLGTPTTTAYYYTSFYLSADNILDAGDISLGTYYNDLKSGSVISGKLQQALSPSNGPGEYYLIGKADANQTGTSQFDETDEINNITATRIFIKTANIDLNVTDEPMHATYFEFGLYPEVRVNFTLKNTGATGAWKYGFDVYVSDDNTFDETDILVYSEKADNIARYVAGNDYTTSLLMADFSRVQNSPDVYGSKYIVLAVNGSHLISEPDYTDNVAVSIAPVMIEAKTPIIEVTNIKLHEEYNDKNESLAVDVTWMNSGTNATTSISHHATIQDAASNTLMWFGNFSEVLTLNQNGSETKTWTINLNTPLPKGNYNITITYDGGKRQMSTFKIVQAPAILSGIVKGEDGTPITKGKLFLYKKQDNGTVIFVDKVDPYTGDAFNFPIDDEEHTLYFIPDKIEFPNHVPTFLGKAVDLLNTSFVSLTKDSAITFDILKIHPFETGTKMISGTVGEETPAGRLSINNQLQSVEGIQVILLNDIGAVVGRTETNGSGYFEFINLPDATYQVVFNGASAQTIITTTLDVDLTLNNVEIIVSDLSGDTQTSVKLKPVITFNDFNITTYGDEPFEIEATSDAAVALTFTSSNQNVAIIENGYINIVGAGTAEITATSKGDNTYTEVIVVQTLVVNKATQAITFAPFEPVSTPDDIELHGTANSGLPISYTSDHPEVASIENDVIKIHSGGVAEITATQEGDDNYLAATSVKRTLIVSIMGIEDPLADFDVHPNPSTGRFIVSRSNPQMRFMLTDIAGRTQPLSLDGNTLDLTHRQPGVYFLTVQEAKARKIIKVIRK